MASVAFLAPDLRAQDTSMSIEQLRALSLEELLDIKITTASLRPQEVREAPATVYVVTEADFRAYGYRDLKDIQPGVAFDPDAFLVGITQIYSLILMEGLRVDGESHVAGKTFEAEATFSGAGEIGALIRSTDWSVTPLGPIATWPSSLVNYVKMVLEIPSPAIIFWGPDQTQIYNQGYAAIMGPRHPRYFGAPYRECWPETYRIIYPLMQKLFEKGEVTRVEKTHIPVSRHGYTEETYFTFTFSPLRGDDGEIAGIFQPVMEVTEEVLSDRRAETLRLIQPKPDSRDPMADVIAVGIGQFLGHPLRAPLHMGRIRQPSGVGGPIFEPGWIRSGVRGYWPAWPAGPSIPTLPWSSTMPEPCSAESPSGPGPNPCMAPSSIPCGGRKAAPGARFCSASARASDSTENTAASWNSR